MGLNHLSCSGHSSLPLLLFLPGILPVRCTSRGEERRGEVSREEEKRGEVKRGEVRRREETRGEVRREEGT